jgi:hypothetical protein
VTSREAPTWREPVRVLVKGASTAVMTSWMGGPRSDLAYPRVVEAELRGSGQPAQVRVTAAVGQRAKDSLATWERDVVTWSPDVIVLHYGQYEAVHLLVPSWIERCANRVTRRPGRLRDAVHRHAVRKAYLGLVLVQTHVDRLVPERWWARRARRIAADLERLVEHVRTVASPLVLIADQLHPEPAWAVPFPGMASRVDHLNAALRGLVDRIDHPDVRLLTISEVVAGLDGDEPRSPDGGHFAPHVHRAVGQALAGVIREWCGSQPHLAASPSPSAPHLTAVVTQLVTEPVTEQPAAPGKEHVL